MECFGKVAGKGDARAIQPLASRLAGGEATDVRVACAHGLAEVAEPGDTHAIQKIAVALIEEARGCCFAQCCRR